VCDVDRGCRRLSGAITGQWTAGRQAGGEIRDERGLAKSRIAVKQ
jgi:hypothetical protein